jgi:hypothetical protein
MPTASAADFGHPHDPMPPGGHGPVAPAEPFRGDASQLVETLYLGALGREADPGALNWGIQTILTEGTAGVEDVAEALGGSDEFQSVVAENGPGGTVYNLYRIWLKRPPEFSGYDYWLGQIAAGNQGQAMRAFVMTPEFRRVNGF